MDANTHTTGPLKTMLITVGLFSFLIFNPGAQAESARTICERPVFKLWKSQQENRLWAPTEETLAAERTGRVFTYNCFTSEEIDQFFSSHADRIENAHFMPILSNQRRPAHDNDDEEGC